MAVYVEGALLLHLQIEKISGDYPFFRSLFWDAAAPAPSHYFTGTRSQSCSVIITFADRKNMTEKLEDIKLRFEEVGQLLAQPETVKDMKKFSQLSKEYRDLEKIVVKYNALREARKHLQQAKEVLDKEKDPDMREFAKSEIDELLGKIEGLDL